MISTSLSTSIATAIVVLASASASLAHNHPITKAEQQKMTPSQVLADLMAGNERFVSGQPKVQDTAAKVKLSASGQYPKAVILSCLDSRVPVEQVFDQGIGDVFVGRVAGNVENSDQLGSMEFATKLAGSKLVLVLGHSSCGAVKGACDGAEMGNLTGLLEKIRPAVEAVKGFAPSDRSSANQAFVARVVEQNVRQTVSDIRAGSEVLASLEASGDIMIVGALYDLETGRVALLN